MQCPKCNNFVADGIRYCAVCGTEMNTNTSSTGMNFDFSGGGTTATAAPKRYQYKVLSQKDKWFSGKFDPLKLEEALNAYAQQGWKVIACATADIPGFTGQRQEFITVLEREI